MQPINPERNGPVTEQDAARAASDGLRLTSDQIRFFENKGYLSLDQLATREEVLEMKASIEDLFERRVGANEGAQEDFLAGENHEVEKTAPQIMNPVNYLPALHRSQCFKNALSIAKQVLGEDAS